MFSWYKPGLMLKFGDEAEIGWRGGSVVTDDTAGDGEVNISPKAAKSELFCPLSGWTVEDVGSGEPAEAEILLSDTSPRPKNKKNSLKQKCDTLIKTIMNNEVKLTQHSNRPYL